LGQ
jgi:uncharacterized membrane protein